MVFLRLRASSCTVNKPLLSVICKNSYIYLAFQCYTVSSRLFRFTVQLQKQKKYNGVSWKQAQLTCVCFPVSSIILMNFVNIERFSKEKAIYKYLHLSVQAYQEYLETSFLGWGNPSEFNHGYSLQYSRGRSRPKSDGCKCHGRGGQNFSLCGGHNE